jgi:uncharacterized OB-fold protein
VTSRSIDVAVFETEPAPRLFGGRERQSGKLLFPCPSDQRSFDREELPRHGTLWSFTIQRISPKSPPFHGTQPYTPFAVGYIELPGALIVESRLTEVQFDRLRIGLPMELTTLSLYTDAQGTDVLTYAFKARESARP